jgi:tellurite methyltransferase
LRLLSGTTSAGYASGVTRSRAPTMCTTIITGFHQDAEGDWVAELACGHSQHVRHRPPWQNRPWVASEAGRAEKLGASIECPTCQMPEVPADAGAYKRTATFTEETVPAGLLRDHRTKPGVWARIVVEAGQLDYTLESPRRTFLLTPERPGVVPPTEPHHVRPAGPVRFHVEFRRREAL